MHHIVLFSGGLASFEMAKRVIQEYGRSNTHIWFFDTLIEDEDLYRFLHDAENWLGVNIEHFADGRHPWEVFRDERFIGNSRVNLCTRVLKRKILNNLLKQHYPSKNVILHFGLEYSEKKRIENLTQKWNSNGYRVDFLLTQPPILTSAQFIALVREQYGLEPPRLYEMGFRHNNCGGACVKAGISQWKHLLNIFPDRYIWHENQEQLTRSYLGKNISILRDRVGGTVHPLTLKDLRTRVKNKSGIEE